MRQRGLFPGIPLAEDQRIELVSPLDPKLWRMVRQPFDELVSRRASDRGFRNLDEGETAQWLRPQIVALAREIFEGDPNVEPIKRNQQFYLRYGELFAIIPKKLKPKRRGDGLTFSSCDTVRNVALWAQLAADGLPDLPRLLIGYLFVAEMTDIKIWIAYPRGKSAGIYLLMPDQFGGMMGIYEPGPDDSPPDDDKGFTIKPQFGDQKKRDSPGAMDT